MPKNKNSKLARQPDGTFSKGTSGNPAGRPKSDTTALREHLSKDGERIIEQVIEQALKGDMTAAKMVLDRILPPLRPTSAPVYISLPESKTPASLATAIITAASQGELPSEAAAQLVAATANLSSILETQEHRRILEESTSWLQDIP